MLKRDANPSPSPQQTQRVTPWPPTAGQRRRQTVGVLPHHRPERGHTMAVYNAVTEYLDHHQPVRGARTTRAAADTRALRAVTAEFS